MRITKYHIINNITWIFLLLFSASAFAAANNNNFWVGMGDMLRHLQENLPAVVRLLNAAAYVTGVWFLFSAMHELRIYGQARTMMPIHISINGPVTRLLLGALLIFFPGMIDVATYTLWGYGKSSIQEYYTEKDTLWAPVINGTIALVRVVGYIAVIRSLILFTRAARKQAQPGQFGKGLLLFLGGTLCVNIIGTVDLLKATFGFGR